MGQVTIHPEAQRELTETISYYEEARTGLGHDFRNEVARFVERIQANPERYSVRQFNVRRANLNRFPYHINYVADDRGFLIVAIAHNRRKPLYWLPRLRKGK